ncbi:unnamed protein product [Symbiodinium necroappetens]|uniref:Uncharacterized protein n=1 Tax=Symbiodinium necroappetens TaxID=1628268 RepID=A0A812T1Y0_9DINO|nr:unnamed protein product [Symbiodinium necroappetens]
MESSAAAAWAATLNELDLVTYLEALIAEREFRPLAAIQHAIDGAIAAFFSIVEMVTRFENEDIFLDGPRPSGPCLLTWHRMAAMNRVDLQADDKGLKTCFTACNVLPEWQAAIVAQHQIETLDDFIFMINKKEWESSVAAFCQEVPSIKDNRLALARVKAAWQAGSVAIESSQQSAIKHQGDLDLDDPLPEATMQTLQSDWKRTYSFIIEPHLEPADSLRGRVHREFKRRSMSVLDARKIKTVVSQSMPSREENITLNNGVVLQMHKEHLAPLRSAVEYYWRLRTLAYAWAWGGNFMCKDSDGVEKRMIDLTECLDYADLSLRNCLEFGSGSVSWYEKNDNLTRGKMASLIRRGNNACTALALALQECHLEWRAPLPRSIQSEATSVDTKKRTSTELGLPPAPKNPRLQTVSMAKGGRKFCKASELILTLSRCTWLVLDLWAGMSGLCVALLGLGVTFYALAAEQDEQARQVRGILLGGGMADTRASQPSHVRRLLDELHASPACADLEIFTLLENVASMQPEAAAQLSKWAGGQPFRSDAQFCGWTKRNRLYWLCSRTQSLSPSSAEAPNDWQWFSHQSGPPELRYVGSKPLPKSVHWLQGYTPITTPQEVMKGHALPFFTFTREFWHPLDSATSESPESLERFHQDNRRFPVKAYRESSLLWKRESWRQPLPEERAQMLGVPTSLLEATESDGDRRKQAQNSRLGNGFHIFTVMVILAMLPQLCQSKLQVSSLQPDQDLRDRISGTPWDPCKRAAFPGLLDAPALVQDIQEQLRDFLVDRSRGYDWYELGPTSLDIDVPLQALSVWREPFSPSMMRFGPSVSKVLDAWPDRAIAAALVKGFEIVGDIDWLRTEAAEAVENIIHSPPPKMHQEILQVTLEEIDKGFCSPLKSKAELDAIFGQGNWRPLERFVLNQQGKLRVIDNARKTNHNAHACLHETIWTTNVDFVPAVIRQALSLLELPQDVPDWIRFRVGTEDLPDAYRGLPVCPEHLAVSIAAVFVPQVGWRFTILWGLAYGLEAAVVAFNRFPCLCIAVSRRCCSALSSSYFDDMLALEAVATSDISRQGVLAASTCMGAPPQPAKSFPPAPDRIFLGVSIHVGDATYDRMLFMQCKESTKRKVCSKLDAILESGTLSRDEASKLRGDIQWMFSACAGNAARYASPLLRQAQCEGIACLTEEDRVVLTCLRHMVRTARPRVMDAVAQAPPFMTIYTDASFEKGELRLGWVLFFPPPQQTLAGTCLVPEAVLSIEEFAFPDAGFRGNLQALLTSASETVGDLPF